MIGLRMRDSKVKSSIAISGFLICCLCFGFSIVDAQTSNYYGSQCSNTTYSADNSGTTYLANIESVVSLLSTGAGAGLKYQNATAGNDTTNMVYGQYDCRGDAMTVFCEFCVHTAGKDIVQRCPNSVSAIVWYDVCILRYSDQKFFGDVITSPWWNRTDNRSISDPQEPTKAENFMRSLITLATGTPLLFARGDFNLSNTKQRYGFVQCSRDLRAIGCGQCLNSLLSHVPTCCAGNLGWIVVAPSCFIRYSDKLFYEVDAPPALGPAPDQGHEHGSSKSRIVAISIASGVIVVLLCYCIYFLRLRHTKTEGGMLKEIEKYILKEESLDADLPLIPFSVIERSTDNFSPASKLGEGGFGPVYKGILPDGTLVAVKRMSLTSSQGVEEFKNEVVLIAKLQHRNLVRLLGCCIEGGEKLLIYEYMPNSSLDFHLFGRGMGTALDWKIRLNIINGIAKGLLYLHEDSRLRVIHRDLKASNILLDDQLNPKISDFGLARTFGGDDEEGSNTRRVMGTYGYMSPEYAMEGLFSIKSDVFSFGVLLLEIISGRKNSRFHHEHGVNLLVHAWKLWGEEKFLQLLDPKTETTFEESQVKKCIHIGLLCVQEDAADRPTMSTVVYWLASDSPTLPKPMNPPFSEGRHATEKGSSSSSSNVPSINVITISALGPR